jgi:hypothetical protein
MQIAHEDIYAGAAANTCHKTQERKLHLVGCTWP